MRTALFLASSLVVMGCSPQQSSALQAQDGVAIVNSVPGPIVAEREPERQAPPPALAIARADELPGLPADRLSIEGWGPVRIGMTLDELNAATGSKLSVPSDPDDEESSCAILEPKGFPRETSVMLLRGTVARIDVYEPGVTTYGGLGVGSPLADVRRVFGDALNERPHFYSGLPSQYLTVWTIAPKGQPDGRGESTDPYEDWIKTRGLRFETDDAGIVTMFRAGSGAIEMVEGCS